MESLIRSVSHSEDTTDDGKQHKYNFRRLEPSIQKFLKVIEIDLSRLERHRINFEKFNRLQDWDCLNRELINASRTLQQIKANLREIEKTRDQIIDEDLDRFDFKIDDVKQHTLVSVNEFLEIYTHIEVKKVTQCESPSITGFNDSQTDIVNSLVLSDCNELKLDDNRLQMHAVPDDTEACESLDNLKQDLLELNKLINDFASAVQIQQEAVDRIDANIDKAQSNVAEGVADIGAAAKLKKVMFPVAGAVLGGIVGGPVGLVAGIKVGAAAAVGGSLLGFASGSIIKKHQNNKIDTELKDMSHSKSKPLCDD